MHLLINFLTLVSVWIWGNWKEWKKYHPTMIFICFINMLYSFISFDYHLWYLSSGNLLSYKLIEILNTSIFLPGTALIFLSRYPQSLKKQIIYLLKWIVLYLIIEQSLVLTKSITYQNNWSFGWSIVFDIILFPSLYLHYRNPVVAYIEFFIVTLLGVIYFHIPV